MQQAAGLMQIAGQSTIHTQDRVWAFSRQNSRETMITAPPRSLAGMGSAVLRLLNRITALLKGNLMTLILVKEIVCQNCGIPTWQPLPLLQKVMQLQSLSHEANTYVNYACPHCK